MRVAVLTWLVEAGEVGDAGRDLAHDGLDLPHDLLVALLLDRPDEHQKTTPSNHDTTGTGYFEWSGRGRRWGIRVSVRVPLLDDLGVGHYVEVPALENLVGGLAHDHQHNPLQLPGLQPL